MVYMHSKEAKSKLTQLRQKGFSLSEISKELNISKSTASLWARNIPLSSSALRRINQREIIGRINAGKARRSINEKQMDFFQREAFRSLKEINYSNTLIKLLCSLIWWCEGNKNESFVRFTNSDKSLIKIFLMLLRQGFNLDEKKFRALAHVHSYHNELTQRKYWSNVTEIPLNQFQKSYQKLNSGKRKKPNYEGCLAIMYYDAKIAKELEAIYNAFTLNKIRGVR